MPFIFPNHLTRHGSRRMCATRNPNSSLETTAEIFRSEEPWAMATCGRSRRSRSRSWKNLATLSFRKRTEKIKIETTEFLDAGRILDFQWFPQWTYVVLWRFVTDRNLSKTGSLANRNYDSSRKHVRNQIWQERARGERRNVPSEK